jgi:hypothetical protein
MIGVYGAPLAAAPGAHDVTYLTQPNPAVGEGARSVAISIRREQHGFQQATVDYATAGETAQAGSDFTAKTGTVKLDPIDTTEVVVSMLGDSTPEGVETFTFTLSHATGGTILRYPTQATISIIDDDGPSRLSFGKTTYSNYENRGSVLVSVVRSGDAAAAAETDITVTDGTATSGPDYTQPTVTTVAFAAGQRTATVQVPLVNDSASEETEILTLGLANPTGAELADPQTAMVEILDDDSGSSDTVAPKTRFHLPRHGVTYRRGETRSLHIISSDDASGVEVLKAALRKKLAGDKCAWFANGKFRRGACTDKQWTRLNWKKFVYWRLGRTLRPTTAKTGIRSYTAYAKAIDFAGNKETRLKKGRNRNTFHVK